MSETTILCVMIAVIIAAIVILHDIVSDDINLLKQRITELERWADSQHVRQRKTRNSQRENRRNQIFVTEADIANQGERDLIGAPY